jgi:hypothetical protein
VPIISNHFTDPVPIYVHTMMRITADRVKGGGDSNGSGCELLPITVHEDTLTGLAPGTPVNNIREGAGSGNFGWLRWTDDSIAVGMNPNSEEYLAEELANPRLPMHDYREPAHKDPNDTSINIDDWVWGLTGNVNSNGVARTELERMTGETKVYRIPVWDRTESSGSNVVYHIIGFALFKITSYDLGGNPKTISGIFHGWANDACPGNGH